MAQIYFGLQNLAVPVGETFEVGVFLDGQGQSLAAIESELKIPSGLELLDIRSGNSVINLWLDKPAAVGSSLQFSGIIPGGFSGDRGELMTLVMTANSLGEQRLETGETKILLNDGAGTAAQVIPAPMAIMVVAEGEIEEYDQPLDLEPPEIFVPVIVDPAQFGEWTLVFLTQDKLSGVAYYEVKEGSGEWVRAESPYTLADQDLHSRIFVRAIDEAGNIREVKMNPSHPLPWHGSPLFWGILAGVLVAVALTLATRRVWFRKLIRRVRR
jgi:hypothetical protein